MCLVVLPLSFWATGLLPIVMQSSGRWADKIKTWTNNFVYVIQGIAKRHYNHIRVKAHAN